MKEHSEVHSEVEQGTPKLAPNPNTKTYFGAYRNHPTPKFDPPDNPPATRYGAGAPTRSPKQVRLRGGGWFNLVTARTAHQCGACGKSIQPTTVYWRLYGVPRHWKVVRELCGICLDVYVLD